MNRFSNHVLPNPVHSNVDASPDVLSFEERLADARLGVLYIFSNIKDVQTGYGGDILSCLLGGVKLHTALKDLKNAPDKQNADASGIPMDEAGTTTSTGKEAVTPNGEGTAAPEGGAPADDGQTPAPATPGTPGKRDFDWSTHPMLFAKFTASKAGEKAVENLPMLKKFFEEKIGEVWGVVKDYLAKIFSDVMDCYYEFFQSLIDDSKKLIREIVEACLIITKSGLLPWYRMLPSIYNNGKTLYEDAFCTLRNLFETGFRKYDDGFAYDLVTGMNNTAALRTTGAAIDLTAGILASPLELVNPAMSAAAKWMLTILKNVAGMLFRFMERRALLKLRKEALDHLKRDGYYTRGAFTTGRETANALTHDGRAFEKWFKFYARWPAVAALTMVSGLVTDREMYARLYCNGGTITQSGQIFSAVQSSQDNRQLGMRYLKACKLKISFNSTSLQIIMSHMMSMTPSFAAAGKTPKQLQIETRRRLILHVLRTMFSGSEGGSLLWT